MNRFACDAMLGSLARWLRFFGYDCFYRAGIDDAELAALALHEERWLLTRDRRLAAVGPRTLLVASGTLDEQLLEVLSRLGLRPEPSLERARCGECNGELHEATLSEVTARVPPHVARTARRFRGCLSCGRVYWPGTHSEHIVARMRRLCRDLSASPAGP